MIAKIKEENKTKIINKTNNFIAFCIIRNWEQQDKLDLINNLRKYNIKDLDIHVESNRSYCYKKIFFTNNKNLEELGNFTLPNIF